MAIASNTFLQKYHIYPFAKEGAKALICLSYPLRRRLGAVDRRIISEYMARHEVRKLHIGCGDNRLEGWLNSDYFPSSPALLNLDATGKFPFPDASFDFIFSEHMIEHVPYSGGLNMLTEAHRVLRKGGVLRISTPDLAFLLALFQEHKSELQQEYIAHETNTFIADAPGYSETFVFNRFVRSWGHTFIYDEKTLRAAMQTAGFHDLERCELRQSKHAPLRDIENRSRVPEQFLRLETMTIEATK